jgi:hypothetical protein
MNERDRLLVVLDLDECLIHTRETPFADRPADIQPGDGIHTIFRPGLDDFLRRVFAVADVAVWSSGTEAYQPVEKVKNTADSRKNHK